MIYLFSIYDGRLQFYQWDMDRKLIVEDSTITEVHFCNKTDDCSLVCETYKEGALTVVNVPNILLQDNWRINVYAYDGKATKHCATYNVVSRSKPADYVYTETETLNYNVLSNRINEHKEEVEQEVERLEGAMAQQAESLENAMEQGFTELSNAITANYNPIINSAIGEAIVVNDSLEKPLEGLVAYGKSEQFTTTGANLLNIEDKTIFENGVTAVCKGGVITCSGTATAQATLVMLGSYNGMEDVCGLPTGTYFVKDITIQIMLANGDVNFAHNGSFDIAEGDYVCFVYRQFSEGEVVNETTYPMLNSGTTALPFEPYTGGKPAPNPDYPQEIVGCEDTELGVYGRNLMPLYPEAVSVLGVTRTLQEDGSYKFTGTSTMTQWTQWINIVGTVPADGIYTFTADADVFTSRGLHFSHKRNGKELSVFATIKKVNVTREFLKGDTVVIMLGVDEGEVVNSTVFAQLEAGNTATAFHKPIDKQSMIIPDTLHGIKVASGGNYIDANGQQWICDYKDYGRGVKVQKILHRLVKSTDSPLRDCTIYTGVKDNYANFRVVATGSKEKGAVMGNMHPYSPDTWSGDVLGCDIVKAGQVDFTMPYEVLGITKDDVSDSTKIGVRIDAMKAYLDTHEVEFFIELETPIETPLTEEELNAYKALHTNHLETTMLTDNGAGLAIDYVADTKTYIDNKFAELASAILA